MSLQDRDWYRAEVNRRPTSAGGLGAVTAATDGKRRGVSAVKLTVMAIVALTVMGLPIAMVPQCELDGWLSKPTTCWLSSWDALIDRIMNTVTKQGEPASAVPSGNATPKQQPKLPNVITPSR
jgi:hypothetical protein